MSEKLEKFEKSEKLNDRSRGFSGEGITPLICSLFFFFFSFSIDGFTITKMLVTF